jgi:hypothetical protein
MKDRDGVVVGLAMALENANRATRFMGSSKEDVLEEGFIDVVGAGAGEKKAACRHLVHDVPVEIFVGAEGFVDIIALFDEGRRIEDHKVVVEGSRFQKKKYVFADETVVREVVDSEVLL